MNDDKKNIIDKFLETYEYGNNNQNVYKRIYQRPTKFKSIVGFIFCLIILIVLIILFVPKVIYFVLVLGDLIILAFYGINVFTKKGIGLPKTVLVKQEEKVEDSDESSLDNN